jgi:hypothetical protein
MRSNAAMAKETKGRRLAPRTSLLPLVGSPHVHLLTEHVINNTELFFTLPYFSPMVFHYEAFISPF